MSNLTKEQKQLLIPSNPVIKEATLKAFKKFNGMDMVAAENFLSKAGEVSVPPPIPAKATVTFALFLGHLTIQPTEDYKNCIYSHDFYGVGAGKVESSGFIYTAYDNWEAFFANVTSFHIQGIAEGKGILQVNFFRSDGLPVGQYNGFADGIMLIEGGNAGKWSCK